MDLLLLPPAVWANVASKLRAEDVARLSMTCKAAKARDEASLALAVPWISRTQKQRCSVGASGVVGRSPEPLPPLLPYRPDPSPQTFWGGN